MSERFAGRYLLLRPLGSGGMGEVFLARDLATGAECALKRLTVQTGLLPPDALAREFEALTRVHHPEIVAVYELGFAPEGTPFYTMEFVPGLPADRLIARGDWAALCFTAARVAHGLEALHTAGVFHGDLKPSNVLVVPGAARALPVAVRLPVDRPPRLRLSSSVRSMMSALWRFCTRSPIKVKQKSWLPSRAIALRPRHPH